jgi:hypothetical protein
MFLFDDIFGELRGGETDPSPIVRCIGPAGPWWTIQPKSRILEAANI